MTFTEDPLDLKTASTDALDNRIQELTMTAILLAHEAATVLGTSAPDIETATAHARRYHELMAEVRAIASELLARHEADKAAHQIKLDEIDRKNK